MTFGLIQTVRSSRLRRSAFLKRMSPSVGCRIQWDALTKGLAMVANRIQGCRTAKSVSSMKHRVSPPWLPEDCWPLRWGSSHREFLDDSGYTVIVNKVGSAPLDHSTVTSVRHGRTSIRTDVGVRSIRRNVDCLRQRRLAHF